MPGPLTNLDYHVLAGFLAGALVAVWSTVMVSGFLPRAAGPAAARGLIGGILVYASAAAVCVLLAALILAGRLLPWTVGVIAAGAAVLGAPFLVQLLPKWFRSSRTGLLAVLALCAVASYTLSSFIRV